MATATVAGMAPVRLELYVSFNRTIVTRQVLQSVQHQSLEHALSLLKGSFASVFGEEEDESTRDDYGRGSKLIEGGRKELDLRISDIASSESHDVPIATTRSRSCRLVYTSSATVA